MEELVSVQLSIGSDVVLTPCNFQAYPELFSFLYPITR